MLDWTIENEAQLRLWFFAGSFLILAISEVWKPRRRLIHSKVFRWLNNFGLIFFNTALLRILAGGASILYATEAALNGWGVFNLIEVPAWLHVLLTVAILDMFIYWQHRIFHRIPVLWKLHRVHHIDRDFDISTSARFHTLEILLSFIIKLTLIVSIGGHPVGVLIFEILLNTASNFNHSNIKIPEKLDRFLQLFMVTPDMHRIHHSENHRQTDSNFSFSTSIWDRIFKSYETTSYSDNDKIIIGLKEFQNIEENRIDQMLMNPFKD
ncbi:MAG: sterol desaturase family protein [Bdellovibrionales bacterium]